MIDILCPMLFRICTENVRKDLILEECNNMLSCFTVYESTGYWKGKEEPALTIETVLPYTQHNCAIIKTLAESIKLLNHQEAILVTYNPVCEAMYL